MANIENMHESWDGHSGLEVEAFIKGKLSTIKEVDTNLDGSSTNPISNNAVTTAINTIDNKTISSFDVEENDDGETIKLSALNKNDVIIASVNLPKGGGGDMSVSKPRVTALVSSAQIKLGDSSLLTYTYDHVNGEGVSDGIRATLEITISRGGSVTYTTTLENVNAGTTGTLDITPYLLAGAMDIYVKATCVTPDNETQVKQAYTTVYVAVLSLSSPYDISASLMEGGYGNEMVTIPYIINGSGTKVITMYVDGVQRSTETITRSGVTNSSFLLDMASLSAGKHNIQIVAERDGLLSESVFFDILKTGSSVPFIGIKTSFNDGRIYTSSLVPTFNISQYDTVELDYVVWTPNSNISNMNVTNNNSVEQTVVVDRQVQQYVGKFDNSGNFLMEFVSGATHYPFYVSTESKEIDAIETTTNLQLKLSAFGRSNDEENPDDWEGITEFNNCDFSSSGWTGSSLKLINGASVDIGYKPFATDAAITGLTIEAELMIDNINDREASVLSCIKNGMGIEITSEEARFYTGRTKSILTAETDDNDQPIYRERPIGVSMKFASGMWVKIAFVLHTRSDNNLMELYINGVRSKADTYGSGDSFIQQNAKSIHIDSSGADVQIRNIRIYNRAISDDEELNNYIVDRPDSAEMLSKYDANNIIGENGRVDAEILRTKHKGVVVFIRQNALDDVNAANDKKRDFLVNKVYWYSPFGEEYDFVAENIYMRIQGTSSTKYPRKNYRLYLAKGESPTLTVNGQVISSHKYAMRANSIPMNLFCLKADYSDSSMTMNTGGAKLFDNIMRQLGLLTPPQRYDSKIRQAIDGIPCDVFCATEEGGDLTYYGQYNFNNEKSKSGKLFGMEGVDGYTPTCPIALESLNNSNECCLFQAPKTSLDGWISTNFDAGFEFNYPEDVFWTQANATAGGGTVATAAQKAAITRLMSWIATVTPSNADTNNLNTFVSQQFKAEVSLYFDVNHLLTYYLITDYWGSVDQRAKNILWRTWDGIIWYPTFYDGDTAMGIRNDSFLAYLYNITRDTWDDEALKYAYEGHDSYLWCLVLANLEEELKAACDTLRGYLTTDRMLSMFNGEQQNNWCERLYNKSGEFKYIIPQIEGVPVDGYNENVKYSYMYALTGNREAHRTYFLRERGILLDARYGTSGYQSDNIDVYINRSSSSEANTISITSGDLYYFGYRTNNGGWIEGPIKADDEEEITLTFNTTLAINDPVRLCGASKITELDLSGLSGHILRQLGLNKCKLLRKFVCNTSTTNMANVNWYMDWSGCLQLEYVDLTGQVGATTSDGGVEIDLSRQSKLKTLLLGGTHVASFSLAKGAPLETLVVPATVTNLTLRYLPKLTAAGLTLEGSSNITSFWFAACPNLDWRTIIANCPNVSYVRIEGLSGTIDSSVLDPYKNYNGIDANGNIVSKCRLVGSVTLRNHLSASDFQSLQNAFPELTIRNSQYSHYWFDDLNTNPANITNEDNKTGPAYYDPEIQDVNDQPNKYVRSGHILLVHDNCKVVAGRRNDLNGKMTLTELSKDNFSVTTGGMSFDLTDEYVQGYDIFLKVPHYWYKGVNDYKNGRKHFFLSSLDNVPASTANVTRRYTLAETLYATGKAVSSSYMSVGDTFLDEYLYTSTGCNICRVDVEEMKQVRFPSIDDQYIGYAFVDNNNEIIAIDTLSMDNSDTNSPADFMGDQGDYDFRSIPANAKWLYFTYINSVPQTFEIIVTDSEEIEAIEPDWVEHKPELIGIYPASASGISSGGTPDSGFIGLRSISGSTTARGNNNDTYNPDWEYNSNGNPANLPTSAYNMTVLDFLNLGLARGEGYSVIPYEAVKDMANLFMVWVGTRNVESVIGSGGRADYNTGYRNSVAFGDTDSRTMGPASYSTSYQTNKIWGIEAWTGSIAQWVEGACMNTPSYDAFKKNIRRRSASWSTDYVMNILQQDGNERRVKGSPGTDRAVARVRFGRYCDIIASSFCATDSFYICYCAGSSNNTNSILLYGGNLTRAISGVVNISLSTRTQSGGNTGTRLYFFGEYE